MVPLAAGVSVQDPVEIRPGEFHPAARQAYRWLKGFMITNREDYEKYRTELSRGAETGNRQARICVGTIRRLQEGEPVSDRYLLGLAWTIIALHNPQMVEAVADQRWDRAHGPHEDELLESS